MRTLTLIASVVWVGFFAAMAPGFAADQYRCTAYYEDRTAEKSKAKGVSFDVAFSEVVGGKKPYRMHLTENEWKALGAPVIGVAVYTLGSYRFAEVAYHARTAEGFEAQPEVVTMTEVMPDASHIYLAAKLPRSFPHVLIGLNCMQADSGH